MADQPPRTPWRIAWQIATSDSALVVLLLGIAVSLLITAWLPQMPSTGPGAYARWLSDVQARFGGATPVMRSLGLFTVTRFPAFRAMLASLAGCLLLRLVEDVDCLQRAKKLTEPPGNWQALEEQPLPELVDRLRSRGYRVQRESPLFQIDRWPWADLFPLLAHVGGLLILLGLLIGQRWGWQVDGLTLQSGEQITLPGTDGWVAVSDDARKTTHSPGLTTFVEERGPGVQISATDHTGRSLSLQQTTAADPVTQLKLALTEDQYFAIPEANLIIRLTPQPDSTNDSARTPTAYRPISVQFYRSPPGRLITEMITEEDESAELTVDEVTLQLSRAPYARVTATFNPGRWPMAIGIALLVAGLLGSVIWPARRFWLREETGNVEGTGDLAPMLESSQEV